MQDKNNPAVTTQLHRLRWAVRATLVLGVTASVVANILHAVDNPISQTIAAWPPLALLLTVELISRVPVTSRWLSAARLVATAAIAGIAAYVSYWHMVGVAARYGETGVSPYLLPLSVDGLIVVASICLVELAGRIAATQEADTVSTPNPAPATTAAGAAGPVVDHQLPIGPMPAPVDKLSNPNPAPKPARKRPPTAKPRVIAAHRRTPDASDKQLAERLDVSTRTVKRWRPPREKPQAPVNGRTPDFATTEDR